MNPMLELIFHSHISTWIVQPTQKAMWLEHEIWPLQAKTQIKPGPSFLN